MHILMLSNFSHRRRIVFCLTVYLENAWRNIGITKQLQVMDVNCGFASNNQGERMIQMQLWLHIFQLSRPPCERRIRYRPFIIVLKVINTCVVERNKKDFSLFFLRFEFISSLNISITYLFFKGGKVHVKKWIETFTVLIRVGFLQNGNPPRVAKQARVLSEVVSGEACRVAGTTDCDWNDCVQLTNPYRNPPSRAAEYATVKCTNVRARPCASWFRPTFYVFFNPQPPETLSFHNRTLSLFSITFLFDTNEQMHLAVAHTSTN